MITKTEVQQVIARCQPHAGFASIDKSLVGPGEITKGDLLVLVEAASCARYETRGGTGSDSDLILDEREQTPFDAYDNDEDDG